MIKKTIIKEYISETNIDHEIETTLRDEIIIWVDTGKPESLGYAFPVSNGKIDWDCNKENWALISSDVVDFANAFAKRCHLIIFS
jgi:hypothetical protein